MWNKIKLSITRNPKAFILSFFLSLTVIWAILEPFVTVAFSIDPEYKYYFLIALLIPAFIVSIVKLFPKDSITIELKNTNTKITLMFGDLFNQSGNIALGVNEFFDSELGKPVSEETIHGHFISSTLGGRAEIFEATVEAELKNTDSIHVTRKLGKQKKYEIGTTVPLEFGGKKYLLFALSKTNEKHEAYTNPSILLKALDGLFTKARSECNGQILNLPLIGTGLSRSGITTNNIIDLILIAVLKSTKDSEITKEIKIVIRENLFNKINLNEIEKRWN
jgi:hypothetical protein